MAILILFYLAVHCFFQMAVKSRLSRMQGQLYEDLLYGYNRVPRPVKNSSDALIVHVGASLIRIIDIVSFRNFRSFQLKIQTVDCSAVLICVFISSESTLKWFSTSVDAAS